MQLSNGQHAVPFKVNDVQEKPLNLETLKGKKVFLAFLRNTQCPLCSLYVYQLLKLAPVLRQNNVEMILFYESSAEKILINPVFRQIIENERNLTVVSDPTRKVYSLYDVEISPEKATLEALQAGGKMKNVEEAAKLGFNGTGQEEGTHPDAIPAEFLLDERLTVVRAHYGNDAGDHLPLRDVEAFAVQNSSKN